MSGNEPVGIFVGLESANNEYIAWLIAPYRSNFQIELGSLLLINNVREDIVARVMDYVPRGEFMSQMGEKWLNEIAAQGAIDQVGQDIKRSKISYRVRVKVLGSLAASGRDGEFSPGLKRIPQITNKVRRPSSEELNRIITKAMTGQAGGIHIGDYSMNHEIPIKFDQTELNTKRTFIFARAGYGKSNLMKVICREWRPENGGLLIFDQDGEYAITDKKGRPGIMDARGALLVTNQIVPPDLGNVYSKLNLNLAEMPHKMILPLIVDPSKHQLVFFAKLMAMTEKNWRSLVNLIAKDGWNADFSEVERLVLDRYGTDNGTVPTMNTQSSEVEIKPILNNLAYPIKSIHDGSSNLIYIIKNALRDGEVVILDISRIDSNTARNLSSLIVRSIFNENRDNFTKYGGKKLIKTTFVLEEAHTVLSKQYTASGQRDTPSAFVDLAKEGRKYGLGGIFITQQPGSIPSEIVSQGDNFFVFHLLSRDDLTALYKANAHYSNDVITQILNEPIRGKSYMWTSHQPFVIPVAVDNFEDSETTKPDSSVRIQQEHPILDGIMQQIHAELNDPTLKSIREKLAGVEREFPPDSDRKAIALYRRLDKNEKKYLEEKNCIQSGVSGPFAVKYKCYDDLAAGAARL